jgi:hypothetical protein
LKDASFAKLADTASAVRNQMKKIIFIAIIAVLSASCSGQPAKDVVRIEKGMVNTRYFSIQLPDNWRVATSETSEVRDAYYPDFFKPLQRFQAYDPIVFEKNLEIGIYEKFVPTFKDFETSIMQLVRGYVDKKIETVDLGGIKFKKILSDPQKQFGKIQVWIGEAETFYAHIVTQGTWEDLDKVISTINFKPEYKWQEDDVSEAETSSAAFTVIGGKFDTKFASCSLPTGWKVRYETDDSVIFVSPDESPNNAIDCSAYPYASSTDSLEDTAKRMSTMMTKPVIEEMKLGKNTFTKLHDPTDGTNRAIFFAKHKNRTFSFRSMSPTPELVKEQADILSSFRFK